MAEDAAANVNTYAERLRLMIDALTAPFADDAVNVVAAHCMVEGAKKGGGERDAQTFMDYWVSATAFPAHAHYVALGHLHRTQQVGARARSGTRARRCRSTSARRATRSTCCSSRRRGRRPRR